jgi:Cof subfamily protein (haloacid dehalogenase superfamily)
LFGSFIITWVYLLFLYLKELNINKQKVVPKSLFLTLPILFRGDIMKQYLIALDLDGTLLKDWESMSDFTREYLKEIQKDGHKIVIATGRPHRSAEKFYDELMLKTPIINYNGGLITCKHDKNFPEYSINIKKEEVISIFKNNIHLIENAFTEVKDDIYLYKDTEKIQPLLHNFNGATLTVGPLDKILDKDPNGFLGVCKKGKTQEFEDYINNTYNGEILARNWGHEYDFIVELYTKETNKGLGLAYVSNYLGFSREHIIAFGDAHNDIEMLQYAHHGVAMKNAQDRLKKTTKHITRLSNEEDGIVDYLKQFLKGYRS